MGILSVLVAAIAGFAVGAVWYMSLAKPWMKAARIPMTPDGRPDGNGSPLPFVVSGVAMILVAGMMRHIFVMSGLDTVGEGVMGGFGIGLFLITPWVAMNYAYSMRTFMHWLIDSGYAVIGCTVIGVVLTLFL